MPFGSRPLPCQGIHRSTMSIGLPLLILAISTKLGAQGVEGTRTTVPIGPIPSGNSSTWVETVPSQTQGGSVPSHRLDWSNRIQDAIRNLRMETLPKPEAAKENLELATLQLQQFLQPDRTENGIRWLEFLRWNDLLREMKSEEPDADTIDQFERNMRQNYLGLEYQPFLQLRSNLERYSVALRYGEEPKQIIKLFERSLDKLVGILKEAPKGADTERQRELSVMVRRLLDANQATDLAHLIRQGFSRPNARVLVSQSFMATQFARPVQQNRPVQENILGTAIFGSSYMNGSVIPKLIPNSRNATLQLQLNAQFSSDSQGTNRGVVVYSHGTAPVFASETITLTDSGIQLANDVAVSAPLHTDIVGIQHRSRIVRRIASKKVAQQQPLANAIGQSKLVARIGNEFQQQIQEQMSKSTVQLKLPEWPAFRRLGLSLPSQSSWSSSDYLALLWKVQGEKQLAAPSSCPIPVEHTGVTVQLHQSAILNALDPVLSNRVIKNSELDDFVRQFSKDVPQKLVEESQADPWSISMAAFNPIEVEFDDDLLKVRIRTTQLKRTTQTLDENLTIEASYRIVLIDNAIQLTRKGDVKFTFSEEQRGSRAAILRRFLKEKFEGVFKEQLLDEPLRPMDRLPPNAPKLLIAKIQMDDGWMHIHLK